MQFNLIVRKHSSRFAMGPIFGIIFLCLLKQAFAQCNVFINEVNIIDPQKPEKSEFIELKTDCEDMPLRGYKVIGVTSGSKNTKASITLVATLWNERFKREFYTIGGVNVDKADMTVNSGTLKFRESWNKNKQISMTNFLINGNSNLNAIGILYKKNDAMSAIQLEKSKNNIPLDDQLIEFLKENLIDLVIYSEKSNSDKCDIFEILHSSFAQKKYVLREFDFKKDISLNRCTIESEGFIPEKFKLGKPTPGTENDCTGTHLIFENRLQDILPSDISPVEIDNSCSVNDINTASMSTEVCVISANAEAARDVCTSQQIYPESGNMAQEIDHENTRKRRLSKEADSVELEWETEKYFEYVSNI